MKARFTLASSIPSDSHLNFIVSLNGYDVGEIHLKRPVPEIPSQYAGELYLWDDEDTKEVNRIRHARPAIKLPEWMWHRDETRVKEPKVPKPKLQAPSEVGGHLKEWRDYFSK